MQRPTLVTINFNFCSVYAIKDILLINIIKLKISVLIIIIFQYSSLHEYRNVSQFQCMILQWVKEGRENLKNKFIHQVWLGNCDKSFSHQPERATSRTFEPMRARVPRWGSNKRSRDNFTVQRVTVVCFWCRWVSSKPPSVKHKPHEQNGTKWRSSS